MMLATTAVYLMLAVSFERSARADRGYTMDLAASVTYVPFGTMAECEDMKPYLYVDAMQQTERFLNTGVPARIEAECVNLGPGARE